MLRLARKREGSEASLPSAQTISSRARKAIRQINSLGLGPMQLKACLENTAARSVARWYFCATATLFFATGCTQKANDSSSAVAESTERQLEDSAEQEHVGVSRVPLTSEAGQSETLATSATASGSHETSQNTNSPVVTTRIEQTGETAACLTDLLAARPLPKSAEELFAESEALAQELVTHYPRIADAQELLARIFWVTGKPLEAEKVWMHTLEVQPGYPYALHGLGQVAAKRGDFGDAASKHSQAFSAAPTFVDAALGASDAWTKTGEVDRAIELLESITAQYGNTALGWIRLGQAYTAARDYDKAHPAFARALELAPENQEALYGFSLSAARTGDLSAAHSAREKLATLLSSNREKTLESRKSTDDLKNHSREIAAKLTSVGQIYFAHKEYDKAEQVWNRAALLDPINQSVRTKLAALHMGFQDAQKALQVCSELVKLAPDNPQYQLNYAMMVDRAQGVNKAIPLYDALAQASPSGQFYAALADAYSRAGNRQRAVKAINQAVELEPANTQWQAMQAAIESPVP